MRIGVPAEGADQPLVASTPDTVAKLIKLGYEVSVETGAGEQARYPDSQYVAAGAELAGAEEVWDADIVLTLDAPAPERLALMHPGATLIARLAPARDPELVERLRDAGVTALALDTVPRISRAQAMDVLSSQSNLAGYRAVVEAAFAFGRPFTGQITAAGKVPPADVYVIGAGVAGLAAIGTAHSMGAQVCATDVRPEVAEQVESMGAEFLPIPVAQERSTDGYAKEMSADQAAAANRLYAFQAAKSDIVITTANVPGRTSPILLDDDAVNAMAPGSVIVDMAAANGGNTTMTRPGEVHTTPGGVIIIGYTDLAGRLPSQSSQLYGQNIVNLLKLMTPAKDGRLTLDLEDQIVRGIAVTSGGEILWPPPKVSVSAQPATPPSSLNQPTPAEKAAKAAADAQAAARRRRNATIATIIAAILLAALVLVTPTAAAGHYIVLMLAVVVGFYVITNVTHSLHTPLMSVTNAISGIILVGAILQVGSSNLAVGILSFVAIVIASINIFGGFLVTHRMLAMFRRD
ncbi:MAG: Re/Si-specific NAD(P)(+) transhydrogenase subunit alpha [Actinomyces sp.]|nr:Re/Si-specific NAD(P)(+) transhydrogenase subunit alpha [Actinomyces sp.]MCI1641751.1 Re/Si-specific NAD(P)(+) transhydrogenase subunit alpha [Actinomyces sp.]MCI1661567.1 Re/Si-specific NAD(P)(+) transhydrogenase subunit alpha [Actinomyces sp.]MCI1690612.1 Re/Si-specific NAD(P)(+) transhydrogenase subunit alpha [Actinomyces sp.]MCI1786648.1 Re/Si-specific NAD(P)(+) transhydrogenase subunit alpha [Actinomyces sp.]MCI1830712.1 Re/Si-specific NAD(P)(+) transhydrogenase subunit alpha [Actinomy